LLFCLTLEQRELPQYSSISLYPPNSFYLNLKGFKSGDKVYIKVSYYETLFNYSPSITYRLSNDNYNTDFSNPFSSLSSSSYSTTNSQKTLYYTIKLSGNYNYILFQLNGHHDTWYTITHTKSSPTWIIVGCVSGFVIIACIVIIICWCRRRSMPDYAPRVDGPLISPYPVVQPQPQPVIYTQPSYHPYV
jgi:hypothetical protein